MKLRLIGDVHGKFDRYKDVIRGVENSVQVGDMGVGFFRYDRFNERMIPMANPPRDTMLREGNHRYIRGNHDNPEVCMQQDLWIPDGTVEDNVMFVGSATSIDKMYRTENFDWWAGEELSHQDLLIVYDEYMKARPEIMVTHECPDIVADQMMKAFNRTKFSDVSNIRKAFEYMWQEHKPKLWVFGHWHVDVDFEMLGTRFICLNELNHIDLDTETLEVSRS